MAEGTGSLSQKEQWWTATKETFSSGHRRASCTHKFTVVVTALRMPMRIQSRPHPDMKMGAERETPLVAMELLAAGSCERRGSWGVSHAPEEDHTSTYNLGNTDGS